MLFVFPWQIVTTSRLATVMLEAALYVTDDIRSASKQVVN